MVGWVVADSEAALENLAFPARFSSRLLHNHRKSWKLYDCHKPSSSLKNENKATTTPDGLNFRPVMR